jgi:hypothetical protein
MSGEIRAPKSVTQDEFKAVLGSFAKAFDDRLTEMEGQVLSLSQALAEKEHGTEAVRAACKWAGPRLQEYAAEHHPYDALMQAYLANGAN